MVTISYEGPRHKPMRRRPRLVGSIGVASWLASHAIWTVAAGLILFGAGAGLWMAASPGLGMLAPAALIFWLAVAAWTVRALRRRRAASVLVYIEQAVRLQLPLSEMLSAAQHSETGLLGRRLTRLGECLEDGMVLPLALERAVPELPVRAVGLIAAADRNGHLPQTLGRLVAEQREARRRESGGSAAYRWYPLVVLLLVFGVLTLFMVFVIPRYEMIFRDFGQRLPGVTMAVIRLARDVAPLMLFVWGLALLVTCGRELVHVLRPRVARAFAGWLDDVWWWLPVCGGVIRARAIADLCHMLADSVEAGMPLADALYAAGQAPLNGVLRHRVRGWGQAVVAGVPLHEAAREAGMPALLVGFLTTGQSSASVAEVLRFTARYYDVRFGRAFALLQGALVPALVLVLAGIVGTVALSMFMPLIQLIDAVNPWAGRM